MRRNMLRTVEILILSFVLSMSMVGCAGKGDGGPDSPDSQSAELDNSDGAGDSNEITDSGEVESNHETGNRASVEDNTESVNFEGADLNGRVLEFSDTGFIITPVYREVFEDGTSNSWEAAPGKEKEEDNIYVTYTEETVFEIVYFSKSLQEISLREDTDKSSIKKQTLVYVFGFSEDEKNWTADKVLIQKWN